MKVLKVFLIFSIIAYIAVCSLACYEEHQTNLIVKNWIENKL